MTDLNQLRVLIQAAEETHIANGMVVELAANDYHCALQVQAQSRDRLQSLRQQLIEAEQFSMEAH